MMNKFDAWVESPYYDGEDNYEELHEQVCNAIMDKDSISYGALNKYRLTPFDSNDLSDKIYEKSGLILQAYIKGDDEAILALVKDACRSEIDSIIDLIGD
jgi:hypothetical protein